MTPFHIKPRCTFKILLNIVLLVTISNIFQLEHKMNPICQCCLRPEKKNLTPMVGISPTSTSETEKAVAPNSSTLAWKIPWMEEPDRLRSMGLLGVQHDWATSLSLFTFMHWRRKWQPTPVFLPGESQGQGSLVGCHPLGRTELDTTEAT